jgi:hypothetical protein
MLRNLLSFAATVLLPAVGLAVAAPEQGTIDGRVLTGPTCPGPAVVTRPDCGPRPLQTSIRIYAAIAGSGSGAGKLLKTVRTDAAGHFQVALPPGTYRLVPLSAASPSTGKPQDITVTIGSAHTVTLFVDAGLR